MSARSRPSTRRLLLVEDDPLVRLSVAMGLEDFGFEVVEAETAESAIEMLGSATQEPPVMAVVTDINLGRGWSGLQLADFLRGRWPDIGIIFITGRIEQLQGRELRRREALLAKPFSLDTLGRLASDLAGLGPG